MGPSLRCFASLAALAIAALAPPALAQTYPEKPIRLVVGFAAGGPTDLPARFIADRLGNALGQRVVVENRTGAGGMIATQDVLSRPRDGYNLLLCTHFEGINVAMHKNPGFKLADIAPITQVSRYYYGIAVANETKASSWAQFVAYARANPGKVFYGSVGRGSAQELVALELGKLTGVQLTGIQYKGGTDAINDLIAGRIHIYPSPTLAMIPLHKAGKVRVVAVSSAERLAALPDVPTLTESGLPVVRFGWLGMCAGGGTPQPIITLLNQRISAIVKAPDYREMIEKAGSIAVSSSPEELRKVLVETADMTAGIVKEFGLQAD